MLSRDWCWVIFPTLAKANQFRNELGGTVGIDPDVPFVGFPPPTELQGGKAGWVCHYWARIEASRHQIEILAEHTRYGGVVTFGREAPADWQPIVEEDA